MRAGSLIRGIGEVEHATPEQILAHPGFAEARRVFVSEHAKVYEAGVFPAQFGADVGRVTTLAIIVCQYAAYDPADRATWPTLSLLKETVARFGFASPRLIDSFVARLVQTDHLELRQHPGGQPGAPAVSDRAPPGLGSRVEGRPLRTTRHSLPRSGFRAGAAA